VTPLAVFQRETIDEARFRLQSWNDAVDIAEVRRLTGFAFDAEGAVATPPVTRREAEGLAALDPEGRFSGAF
jgi:acyl CoA:acetate/3-ketoacid CoA transferase beta subunit